MQSSVRQSGFERFTPDFVLAIGSLVMLAAGMVFVSVIYPMVTRFIPTCPFLWTTGCYCPGCGATRALHSLSRGDVATAIGYNPLLMLSLPIFAYVYLSFLSGEFFGRRFPTPTRLRAYTWLVPVVIIGYWIARNLPWQPFTWLAP